VNALPTSLGPTDGDIFEQITSGLRHHGHVAVANALPSSLSESLFMRVQTLDDQDMHAAGVGRNASHQKNRFVRRDRVHWLERDQPVDSAFLDWMEQLRLALNERLYLGLFDYECHFAHYPPGAFYKRHVDAFRGRTNRVLTTVFYLNPGWTTADGGELLFYEADEELPFLRLLPTYGTLVVFLSDEFPHEVLKAHRDRYSIAGWFRVNTTLGGTIDPPN
jgi:SM-20-related protein